jgi:hypothetical protein
VPRSSLARIPVVRLQGAAAGLPERRLPSPPPPLTRRVKAELLRPLRASVAPPGPFALSPDKPYIAGRGGLAFFYSAEIDCVLGTLGYGAMFPAPKPLSGTPELHVLLFAPLPRRYLFDCVCTPTGTEPGFTVTEPNGVKIGDFPVASGEHLLLVLEMPSHAQGSVVRISRAGGFVFYSCELTPLQ